jgi:hypothetical protein
MKSRLTGPGELVSHDCPFLWPTRDAGTYGFEPRKIKEEYLKGFRIVKFRRFDAFDSTGDPDMEQAMTPPPEVSVSFASKPKERSSNDKRFKDDVRRSARAGRKKNETWKNGIAK